MPTPEINHPRWTSFKEHLKNPAELLVLTAIALGGVIIGERLHNLVVPFINSIAGK